jgi:hypothetical protein
VQTQPRSRVGLYVLVTIVVLVLGGAGGYGAWYLITEKFGSTTTTPPASIPEFKPRAVQEGSCITEVVDPALINEPEGTPGRETFQIVGCETAAAFEVLKIEIGPHITALGEITQDKGDTLCAGVEGYRGYAWWDAARDEEDAVFCVGTPG